MRLRILVPLLLLVPLPVRAFDFNFESGFYYLKSKNALPSQSGYEEWKGKKSGLTFRLEFGDQFKIKKTSRFRFSITSGSQFNPFVPLFASEEDRISENGWHTFHCKNFTSKRATSYSKS